jgi:TPR repeat protein
MRVAAAAGDTTASVWVARALTRNGEEIVDTAAVYSSLRDAARKSCLGAMVLLGDSYLELSPSFRHLAPDFEAAEVWYRMAASRGFGPGLGRIGRLWMLEQGESAPGDSAYHYLSLAAAKGHARSFYWMGVLASKELAPSTESRSALELFTAAADSGDTEAMVALGDAFRDATLGAPQDLARAMRLYRTASALGDPAGMTGVAVLYCRGAGVPKDEVRGLEEYRKAAVLGNGTAQYVVGLSYSYGSVVERNVPLGYAWLNIACAEAGLDGAERAQRIRESATMLRATSRLRIALSRNISPPSGGGDSH